MLIRNAWKLKTKYEQIVGSSSRVSVRLQTTKGTLLVKVEVGRVQGIYSIKPKAAATPAATTPAPYSPPMANMVAAAPVEVLEEAEVAAVAPEAPEEVGLELAEELLLEAGATNLFGSRWPQLVFSSELHFA